MVRSDVRLGRRAGLCPFGLTELVVGKGVEPADDFGFELDLSPTHSSDAAAAAGVR